MIDRRAFLAGATALLANGAARADAQAGQPPAADPVDPDLRARAIEAVARHRRDIWSRDVVAVADFALPSWMPRLFLIDLLRGGTTALLCAHGRGSDPEHSGFLQSFSNVQGSLATSEGAYITGEGYEGIHGASRRLIGLDPTNYLADPRAIVIHSAWYVGPDVIAKQGKLGRSDGCFAVSTSDIATLLTTLGRGRLLYAGRGAGKGIVPMPVVEAPPEPDAPAPAATPPPLLTPPSPPPAT